MLSIPSYRWYHSAGLKFIPPYLIPNSDCSNSNQSTVLATFYC